MKSLLLALAALTLTAGALRSAEDGPRLSVTGVDGEVWVRPPQAPAYPLRGPVVSGALTLIPGSIIEVSSGTAAFDSDLNAALFARAGTLFHFAEAEPQGRGGLRVWGLLGAAPLRLEIGGTRLDLWGGGRVAVYDGGFVEVEADEVALAQGSELREGESMRVSTVARPGRGLTPGDLLSLNIPARRAVAALSAPALPERPEPAPLEARAPEEERTTMVSEPLPAPRLSLARVRPKPAEAPAAETLLARAPMEFDSGDATLRNAVGAAPAGPATPPGPPAPLAPRVLETPPPAVEAAAEPYTWRERWQQRRTQVLGAAALALTALLLFIEGMRR